MKQIIPFVFIFTISLQAQENKLISCTYSGEFHSNNPSYLTLAASSRGQPISLGISIHHYDEYVVYVCGHDGIRDDDKYYCGGDNGEWVYVDCRDLVEPTSTPEVEEESEPTPEEEEKEEEEKEEEPTPVPALPFLDTFLDWIFGK